MTIREEKNKQQINKNNKKQKQMETIKLNESSIKKDFSTATDNFFGAIIGGVAGYFAAKKLAKVENKWGVIAITAIGAVLGGTIEAKIKSKKAVSKPAVVIAK